MPHRIKKDKNEVSHADAFILSVLSEVPKKHVKKVSGKFKLPKKLTSPAGKKVLKYLLSR